MKPPNVTDNWEDCDVVTKREMLAYYNIREIERMDEQTAIYSALAKALGAR